VKLTFLHITMYIQVPSSPRDWLDPSFQLHVPLVDVDKVYWLSWRISKLCKLCYLIYMVKYVNKQWFFFYILILSYFNEVTCNWHGWWKSFFFALYWFDESSNLGQNNSTLKLLFWIIKMDLSLMMMSKNTDELVMN
jgi:hypothetical protein